MLDSFPGSGDVNVPLDSDTWMTITDGMAAVTSPAPYHTAGAAHLEGIDFAGKTGTAQVVGGGDAHTKGRRQDPNVLVRRHDPPPQPRNRDSRPAGTRQQGFDSARIAAQMITAYVNKQRLLDHNILEQAGASKPVEVGAVWSVPESPAGKPRHRSPATEPALHDGDISPSIPPPKPALGAGPKAAAHTAALAGSGSRCHADPLQARPA